MADDLVLIVDKFTFRFPRRLRYTEAGLWIRENEGQVRIGLSDFMQQRSGDVAFANVLSPGTVLNVGDELGSIETVKVDLSLPSPLSGVILEANQAIRNAPELINQDPYGAGWIVAMKPQSQGMSLEGILDAESYFALVREKAESELKS